MTWGIKTFPLGEGYVKHYSKMIFGANLYLLRLPEKQREIYENSTPDKKDRRAS